MHKKAAGEKMISFHVPDDKDLLSALGSLTLRHEHMNHILKMTIRSLADLTPEEAFHALKRESTSSLRQRINKLAKKVLGEGKPLLRLQSLLGRAGDLSKKRNGYVHGIWAIELDGDALILDLPEKISPSPTVEQLEKLGLEIEALTNELNTARLDGWLKEAIISKGKV
ncbi:MAG: hypothetical protein P8Z78_08325 [Gammaproteobacteria bacterium]